MLFNIDNTVDVNLVGDALDQLTQTVNKLSVIINSFGLDNSKVNLNSLLGNVKSSIDKCSRNEIEENKKLDRLCSSVDNLVNYFKSGIVTNTSNATDVSGLSNDILQKLLNAEYKVVSVNECKDTLDNIYQLLKNKLDNLSENNYSNQSDSDRRTTSFNQNTTNESNYEASRSDSESLSRALSGNENKSSVEKSREESLNRALEGISEGESKSNFLLTQISKIGKETLDVLEKSFRGVFDKWNENITELKRQGMGSSNAAQLNRMTRKTMESSEDILGFNISIEKAISSTKEILESGFSPTYMRENNKQLLMGIASLGIKLESATIREIGNQVFDATHVKELTGDLAKLVSPDSENRMDAAVLARAFNSAEFKKIIATSMMQTGASRQEVEKRFAELLIQNKQAGRGDDESIERAYMDLQSTLGGGAYVYTSKNLQSMIALQRLADPNWDLKKDGLSSRVDVEAYNSNARYKSMVDQISPTLMMSGDETAWNVQNNDGTIRRFASEKEIEEGQYEGFIPRVAKNAAGLFNAESMGGVSQSLTGDSKFITNQSFDVAGAVGGLLKDAVSQGPQIMYLKQIAHNTGRGGGLQTAMSGVEGGVKNVAGQTKGIGASFKNFAGSAAGKFAGAAGIIMTVADTATDIYAKVDEIQQSEKLQAVQQERLYHLDERTRKLQQQYNEALLNGDKKQAEETRKMLEKTEEQRNQNLKKQMELEAEAENAQATAIAKGVGVVVGGTIGAIVGGPLGAAIGGEAGNILGGGFGKLYGAFNTVNDQDAINEARKRRGARYADGGIITKEHEAVVGEGGKPEVIIPLTKPNRAEELMSEAAKLPSTNPEVASMLNKQDETNKDEKNTNTVADNIIAFARAQIGKPYTIYDNGFVCNTLVQSALKAAGLKDFPRGTVGLGHWRSSKLHKVPLSEAKAGMIGFSNLSKNTGMPQHMGIITENGMWINASGSAVNGNYRKGEFVASPKSKGVIEAKMNTKNSWGMVSAGYYDGMFDPAETKTFIQTTDNTNPSGVIVSNESLANSNDISDISPLQQTYIPNGQYTRKPNPMVEYKKELEEYKKTEGKVDESNKVLNDEVVDLLLNSKLKESPTIIEPLLYDNNPLGLKEISGKLSSFNSFEEGINEFIAKVERQLSALKGLDTLSQLDLLKSSGNISVIDYSRIISSFDRLSSAVEENNRINNRNRVYPTSQNQKRTYIS